MILPPATHAAGYEREFGSWHGLAGALQRYGIAPHQVNWAVIEPMCLSLKTETDQTDYNRCKFERAREQALHQADYQECKLQAHGAYPSYLGRRVPIRTYQETDATGYGRSITLVDEPLRSSDIRQMRVGSISSCMQNMGWTHSTDWRLGVR